MIYNALVKYWLFLLFENESNSKRSLPIGSLKLENCICCCFLGCSEASMPCCPKSMPSRCSSKNAECQQALWLWWQSDTYRVKILNSFVPKSTFWKGVVTNFSNYWNNHTVFHLLTQMQNQRILSLQYTRDTVKTRYS